ncbi:14455_t:CDS:2 [Rhizophagus irregularis]|nr:14455_t:CDS:2 [Rhizophagus irregularis]
MSYTLLTYTLQNVGKKVKKGEFLPISYRIISAGFGLLNYTGNARIVNSFSGPEHEKLEYFISIE